MRSLLDTIPGRIISDFVLKRLQWAGRMSCSSVCVTSLWYLLTNFVAMVSSGEPFVLVIFPGRMDLLIVKAYLLLVALEATLSCITSTCRIRQYL